MSVGTGKRWSFRHPHSTSLWSTSWNYSVLQKLYIAPAKTKNWSDDKLQNQTVGKNGRFTIHDVSKGIYDLKETDDDNGTPYFQIISVDQNTEWKLTDAMIDNCDEE